MIRGVAPLCALLLVTGAALAPAAEVAFSLTDQWEVSGIDTGKWHSVRLTGTAPESVRTEVELGGTARYGVIKMGTGDAASVAVLLDYEGPDGLLYVDRNYDQVLDASDRLTEMPGSFWEITLTPPGLEVERTCRMKLGVAGRMILFTLRGCQVGRLPTEDGTRAALMLDVDGDGIYTTDGRDQICVDINEDGKFDPGVERVSLRPSVHVGDQEFALTVHPEGRVVDIAVKDRPTGSLLPKLAFESGELKSATVTLVRDDGMAFAVREFNKPMDLPEGTYRLAGATIRITDEAGVVWYFPFEPSGATKTTYEIAGGKCNEVSLLTPLRCELKPEGQMVAGQSFMFTVDCFSAEGMKMGNATRGSGYEAEIPAVGVLIAPDGEVIARNEAGYS